ncbi:MAG: HKD family nuclease [Glaciecola sp.]|jgi:HKD family nuclease
MEFISNSYNTNHKDTILTVIDWAEECYLCTSFFDKEGLEIILPSFEKGILDRQLKIKIFSNGQNKYTHLDVKKSLKKFDGIEHIIIKQKGLRLHSKIYLFVKEDKFVLIIGSANLTGNGLIHNEEFSTKVEGNIDSVEYIEVKKYFEYLSKLKSA